MGEAGRLGSLLLGDCRRGGGGGGGEGGHEMEGDDEHEECSRPSSTNCRLVLTLSWSSISESSWSEYPGGEVGARERVSLK